MLSEKELKLLKFITDRCTIDVTLPDGRVIPPSATVNIIEITFRLYTQAQKNSKTGIFISKEELYKALDELTNLGYIDLNSAGEYWVTDLWKNLSQSDKLLKINKKTGIFEMKHIKTFESFDPDYATTCCPVCHSDNVDIFGNGECECIDCGEVFSDEPVYDDEPESTLSHETMVMDEEEEVPALNDDEKKAYDDATAMMNKIVANAAALNPLLADQLKYESEQVDSLEEFSKRAIATIQDIQGIDRAEAIIVFDKLAE